MDVPLEMISHFPAKNLYNPGGYKGFKFLPAQALSSYPAISNNLISQSYSLPNGNEWLNGYATAGTLIYKESGQLTDNGTAYMQEISGFVPGDKVELIALMDEMQGLPFLIQITDKLGKTRVPGTHGYPLIFTAEFNSGSNRADARGYTIKFTGESLFRAPVYNP